MRSNAGVEIVSGGMRTLRKRPERFSSVQLIAHGSNIP